MSSDYSPKPGDSVKLVGKANPDNVLYGTIFPDSQKVNEYNHDTSRWRIYVGDVMSGDTGTIVYLGDWTITLWTRPVKFKPFAVVRLPEVWDAILHPSDHPTMKPVVLFTRTMDDYWSNYGGVDWELSDADVAFLLNHGAEILFAGVATEEQS